MRSLLKIMTSLGLMTLLQAPAGAAPVAEVACRGDGSRVALLIGNAAYTGSLSPLANPQRDTAAFAAILCQHGFTVFRNGDLDVKAFDATMKAFAREAK